MQRLHPLVIWRLRGKTWVKIQHPRHPHGATRHLFVPQKILHNLCFSYLLGITAVPRENENNDYVKSWGANKVHWGRCARGEYLDLLQVDLRSERATDEGLVWKSMQFHTTSTQATWQKETWIGTVAATRTEQKKKNWFRPWPNVELFMRRTKLSELSSWKVPRLAQLSSSEQVRIVPHVLSVCFRARIERLKVVSGQTSIFHMRRNKLINKKIVW